MAIEEERLYVVKRPLEAGRPIAARSREHAVMRFLDDDIEHAFTDRTGSVDTAMMLVCRVIVDDAPLRAIVTTDRVPPEHMLVPQPDIVVYAFKVKLTTWDLEEPLEGDGREGKRTVIWGEGDEGDDE